MHSQAFDCVPCKIIYCFCYSILNWYLFRWIERIPARSWLSSSPRSGFCFNPSNDSLISFIKPGAARLRSFFSSLSHFVCNRISYSILPFSLCPKTLNFPLRHPPVWIGSLFLIWNHTPRFPITLQA